LDDTLALLDGLRGNEAVQTGIALSGSIALLWMAIDTIHLAHRWIVEEKPRPDQRSG
jgi:hypothetical protein